MRECQLKSEGLFDKITEVFFDEINICYPEFPAMQVRQDSGICFEIKNKPV